MEAMDQLLRNCQSQHLNLYVESYLKTVQKLLECPEPDMQVNTTIRLKKGHQHPSTLEHDQKLSLPEQRSYTWTRNFCVFPEKSQ